MTSVAASGLIGRRSPASRYKDLLLGPPLATSRLVRERLRKVVALAVGRPRHVVGGADQ